MSDHTMLNIGSKTYPFYHTRSLFLVKVLKLSIFIEQNIRVKVIFVIALLL